MNEAARRLRDAGDTFMMLLCSDPELLDAEFDAIIAANWGAPPAKSSPAGDDPHQQVSPTGSRGVRRCDVARARRGSGLQRSPPVRRNVAQGAVAVRRKASGHSLHGG
jgi:hypothetical protein